MSVTFNHQYLRLSVIIMQIITGHEQSKHHQYFPKHNYLISPPGNVSFRSGLMFYCECFIYLFVHHSISEFHQLIGTKFCSVVCSRQNFEN